MLKFCFNIKISIHNTFFGKFFLNLFSFKIKTYNKVKQKMLHHPVEKILNLFTLKFLGHLIIKSMLNLFCSRYFTKIRVLYIPLNFMKNLHVFDQ